MIHSKLISSTAPGRVFRDLGFLINSRYTRGVDEQELGLVPWFIPDQVFSIKGKNQVSKTARPGAPSNLGSDYEASDDLPLSSQPADITFRIRDYRPADFDCLWQIDQLCFPPGIAYTQMELSGFVTRRNAITLIGEFQPAVGGDPIAGFVIAQPVRGKYGRVLTLDILPRARRFGLATQLMRACEERLRTLGCGQIYLETAVDNEGALRLYRKLGYEVLRTLPAYYSSHALDAFQMGKRL